MTDALYGPAAEARPRFRVRRVVDRRVLDAALSEDRAYAAYALGHLEPGLFEQSRFWLAEGPSGSGVLLHADGLLGRTTVVVGDPHAVDALVALHPGTRGSYLATGSPDHLEALRRTYLVLGSLEMRRMSVTAATFAPRPSLRHDVRRLGGHDTRALNMLYSTEGPPTAYTADQVNQSVYYGAFEANRLVSVAGTHVVAPHAGVAVVGNVFTHAKYRGLGLAECVTSAVTDELLNQRGCALVTLTVNPANTPAVRAYTRLGYEPGVSVIEARIRRKDALGVTSLARRWLARRAARGGDPGDELATARG
ncbi:MAG: GNAT family N-acetyltransferase [Dehalococcoidia bacterium]|nr:GNAT family N-acetyltransferase [Dehalococcoidia bacterium]